MADLINASKQSISKTADFKKQPKMADLGYGADLGRSRLVNDVLSISCLGAFPGHHRVVAECGSKIHTN